MEFHGKVVAITGAAGGIGQELCAYFDGRRRGDCRNGSQRRRPEGVSRPAAAHSREGDREATAVADIGDARRRQRNVSSTR